MEKWKKEAGAENFEIAAGDWSYYIMTSKEYLKTTNILPEDATGKKVLKFIKANQSSTIIRLDTLKKHLGLYLFSVEKEPVYANIVSIEDSYKTYFNGIAAIEVKK